MPKQRSPVAAHANVDDAQCLPVLDLVADLAEPLAPPMLARYVEDEWRQSRDAEELIRVADLFDARSREVPSTPLWAIAAGACQCWKNSGPAQATADCGPRSW